MPINFVTRVTAEAAGWMPGFKVWDLRAFDSKGNCIVRVSENMNNNHDKVKLFTDELKSKGFCLTQDQCNYLSSELSLYVPYVFANSNPVAPVTNALAGSNMFTGNSEDITQFSPANRDILRRCDALNQVYVNFYYMAGMEDNQADPVTVTWSQGGSEMSALFFAEIYIKLEACGSKTHPLNLAELGSKTLTVLFTAAECGRPPRVFRSSGATLGNGVLLFGATTARDQVFFTLMPSSWRPFQKRFLSCMPGSFFDDVTAKINHFVAGQVAGKVMKAGVNYVASTAIASAAAAAGTAVCPVVGTAVGYALGAASGWVAGKGAEAAINCIGDYLRMIGNSDEQEFARQLPTNNVSVSCHEHPLSVVHNDLQVWGCDGPNGCPRQRVRWQNPTTCVGITRYSCPQCNFDLCASCLDSTMVTGAKQKATRSPTSPSGYFLLVSEKFPSVCLDVKFGNKEDGGIVWTYPINRSPAQQWRLTSDGYIESALTNKLALDITAASRENGAKIVMWTKHGGPNQKWRYDNGMIISELNGKVLDLHGDSRGPETQLHTWSAHGGPNQKWRMVPV